MLGERVMKVHGTDLIGGFHAEIIDDVELRTKRWICIKRINIGDVFQTELGFRYLITKQASPTSFEIELLNNRHADGNQNNRTGESAARPAQDGKQAAAQEDSPASGAGDIAPSGATGGAEEQRADDRQKAGEDTSTNAGEA